MPSVMSASRARAKLMAANPARVEKQELGEAQGRKLTARDLGYSAVVKQFGIPSGTDGRTIGENIGSLSSERQVTCVSPHDSDRTRPWNTYRFGLLLVLDRSPNHLDVGR